ncbi:MAG: hypothetical protein M3Z04_14715 [Chloroflexota bacterium]|nr:hypothetical protein [Chloroflexota bacterium]
MNWLFLVLACSLLTAGASVLDKHLMSGAVPPFVCVASFAIVGLPVGVAGVLLLPPVALSTALLGSLGGVAFVFAAWVYYALLAQEAVSWISLLLRLTAVHTLIGGIVFLGDQLTARQWLAFAVLVVSSVLVSLRPAAAGQARVPQAAWAMLGVTGLLAADNLLRAYVSRTAGFWQGQVWEDWGTIGAVGALGLWRRWRRRAVWHTVDRSTWAILISEQTLRFCAGLAPAWAVAAGVPAALISALNGLNPLWVWLLALVLLHERTERGEGLRKGVCLCAMLVGVGLLL